MRTIFHLFTSVFSHFCISTKRKAFAIPSLASINANRIPIQLLEIKNLENIFNTFSYRGPSPKGRKLIGCRFAFSSDENLSNNIHNDIQ
jgi:hypothetical protein